MTEQYPAGTRVERRKCSIDEQIELNAPIGVVWKPLAVRNEPIRMFSADKVTPGEEAAELDRIFKNG